MDLGLWGCVSFHLGINNLSEAQQIKPVLWSHRTKFRTVSVRLAAESANLSAVNQATHLRQVLSVWGLRLTNCCSTLSSCVAAWAPANCRSRSAVENNKSKDQLLPTKLDKAVLHCTGGLRPARTVSIELGTLLCARLNPTSTLTYRLCVNRVQVCCINEPERVVTHPWQCRLLLSAYYQC